jgi:hypothetical protein
VFTGLLILPIFSPSLIASHYKLVCKIGRELPIVESVDHLYLTENAGGST